MRQQKGCVVQRGADWILGYRTTINDNGTLKTIHKAKVIGPRSKYSDEDARSEADRILAELNRSKIDPEHVATIGDFVKNVYWPFVEMYKRPSTLKGYRELWRNHLVPRCGDDLIRDIRARECRNGLRTLRSRTRPKMANRCRTVR